MHDDAGILAMGHRATIQQGVRQALRLQAALIAWTQLIEDNDITDGEHGKSCLRTGKDCAELAWQAADLFLAAGGL